MTVANLERIYPIKVYKKCRNVGEHLVIGPFSLIFIEIVLGILGVRLIYQCISSPEFKQTMQQCRIHC